MARLFCVALLMAGFAPEAAPAQGAATAERGSGAGLSDSGLSGTERAARSERARRNALSRRDRPAPDAPLAEPDPEPGPVLRWSAEGWQPLLADPGRLDDPALIAAGAEAFRRCRACHQQGPRGAPGVGPAMAGIFGAPAGSVPGYRYSPALREMAAEGLVWDAGTLDGYLISPKHFMPGTSMTFAGMRVPQDRLALIAWLASLPPQ